MQCDVRVYYNTNFNYNNIPDSPSLVESYSYRSFNSVYVKQDQEIITLKIETTWDNIKNGDYCRLRAGNDAPQFYFITSINMINDNVAQLSLLEDTITSCGGINELPIISGWAERLSVGSDGLFTNNLVEDFVPQTPFVIENWNLSDIGGYDNDITVVAATVDLASLETYVADVYVATEGDQYSVSVPRINKTPTAQSVIALSMPNGGTIETSYPSVWLFDFSNLIVQKNIEKIRSLGVEGCIIASYRIPKSYISSVEQSNGLITKLTARRIHGLAFSSDAGALGYEYGGYTPKNNKVYSMYNSITIANNASGDAITYNMQEVYVPGTNVPGVDIISNLAPNGRPMCRPVSVNGQRTDEFTVFSGSINGGTWLDAPIRFTEASGAAIADAGFSISKSASSAQWKEYHRQHSGAAGALEELSTDLKAVFGGITSQKQEGGTSVSLNTTGSIDAARVISTNSMAIQNQLERENMKRSMAREELAYQKQTRAVEPTVMFNFQPDAQMFFGNKFYAITTRLSDTDLKRFDDYLTMFGYAVFEPLTKDKLFTRQNFNFVRASSILLSDTNDVLTYRRRQNIRDILAAGVRIWHVKPGHSALLDNPIN